MTQQETLTKPAPPAAAPAVAPKTAPAEKPRRKIFPLIVVILGVAAFFIWRGFFANPKVPENIVTVSGRIEGDDSAVAPKTAGRIVDIHVREGDMVKAGDVIATLDDAQIRAREDQAKAALAAAESRVRTAGDQIAVYQQQLQQNDLQTEQSKVDAHGRVKQAEAEIATAESELAQQEAALKIAEFDKEAYEKLLKTGAASERQATQAAATANQQTAAVNAARRRVDAAKAALTTAQASLSNPGIRELQASTVRKQIEQQRGDIATQMATTQQARFQLAEAEENRRDLTIVAPFDGTVITRSAEPGEVVQAGTAIVTLLDLSKVYLRGYVPEGEIGKVKIGQPARVYLDSAPDKPIDAAVLRIDPQATFTPENTYFRDDRVKQVVGVKLQIKSSIGLAKPGMPADGEILVQGDTWPSRHYISK
jgi:HlyD family secretion protein